MITACRNADHSLAVVVLNQRGSPKDYQLRLQDKTVQLSIPAYALQTLVII
jgi:hypothetical protein